MIQVPVNMLAAVALASGVKDIRYYLNGVLLEVRAGRAWLAATDGERMHVGQLSDTAHPDSCVIIPIDTVKSLVKAHKAHDVLSVQISGSKSFKVNDFEYIGVDGVFPDWRRAIPKLNEDDSLPDFGFFDPALFQDVGRAAKLLGVKKPTLSPHSIESSGMPDINVHVLKIVGRSDFLAVVMGSGPETRSTHPDWTTAAERSVPDWVR